MNLLIRFLMWLARGTPPRVITGLDDKTVYLTRYFLLGGPATEGMDRHAKTPRFGLYLHRFHRGDQDRELHNHPWRWAVSLVLKSGYSEERRISEKVVRRQVRPWSFNVIRGSDFHRVDLNNGEAWTLFLVGPVVQSWGFWNRESGVFTPWKKFLGLEAA